MGQSGQALPGGSKHGRARGLGVWLWASKPASGCAVLGKLHNCSVCFNKWELSEHLVLRALAGSPCDNTEGTASEEGALVPPDLGFPMWELGEWTLSHLTGLSRSDVTPSSCLEMASGSLSHS